MKIPYNAARYADEPFDVYQLRRWTENLYFKFLAWPKLYWNSAKRGTFKKPKDASKV